MDILQQRREPLGRIARELMRKETLERTELDRLVAAAQPVQEAPLR
jgi:hypothetical protein